MTGLTVTGKTQIDNNLISEIISENGFEANWNAHEGHWFFAEYEEAIESLEWNLRHIFLQRGICARFEIQS